MININLKHGLWHFDPIIFFNILQNCPLLESISLDFYKFGELNAIFQEQRSKNLIIKSSKLKKLNLSFGYPDGLDYQELVEWLLQVRPLLVSFTLYGKVIDTEKVQQSMVQEAK